MEVDRRQLDQDVQHKIYLIQAVEEEPAIWKRAEQGPNKSKFLNRIARNMCIEFNTNRFSG